MFETFFKQGLFMMLLASGIPLVVSSVVGLVVGVIQTATSIQEQSISYVFKFGAVVLVFVCMSGWLCDEFVEFTRTMLESISYMGR